MRVALKYCGGCDPAYDRVEYFERIDDAAGDRIEWVGLADPGYSAALLICGCHTACPEDELPPVPGLVCLKDNGLTPEEVIGLLVKKGRRNGHQDQG